MENKETTPSIIGSHEDSILSVSFSPDGKYVVTGSADKTIRLWEVEAKAPPKIFKGHTDRVNMVAFFPDGNRIVSASWDQTVRLWNIHDQKEMLCIDALKSPEKQDKKPRVFCVSVSHDGYMLAIGGEHCKILM
jgi:WD40 repeat protein